jgi:prophage tail gpP-like protein
MAQWLPRKDINTKIPGVIKAALSSDGTVLATMMANKRVVVFSLVSLLANNNNNDNNKWQSETIDTKDSLTGLSSSSLSLSANGQVLSLLQHTKNGQAVHVMKRTRKKTTTNRQQPAMVAYEWILDSVIQQPPRTTTSTKKVILFFLWMGGILVGRWNTNCHSRTFVSW